MSPIRILIADDHAIFRFGLRGILAGQEGLEVVGEATDGQEALAMALECAPDVVLLDLSMPRHPGLEVIRGLAAMDGVRVLVLTASIDRATIVDAVQRGARGVVLKESATSLVIKAVRAVAAGELWVNRDAVADIVAFRRGTIPPPADERARFGLTPRELDIVRHIAQGGTNRDIATVLGISEATVKQHLRKVFGKLGVSNRLELGLFAVNNRLVD